MNEDCVINKNKLICFIEYIAEIIKLNYCLTVINLNLSSLQYKTGITIKKIINFINSSVVQHE